MLEWVIGLLVTLAVAGGGVAGVTTAQDHQGPAPTANAANLEANEAAADAAALLEENAAMIAAKLEAAAEHAAAQAQDALAGAAEAAANGLSTAIEAITSAGLPSELPAGPPSDLPGPGDHPGP